MYNLWHWQALLEITASGSKIPGLEACLSKSHNSQGPGQKGTSSSRMGSCFGGKASFNMCPGQ